MRIFKNKHFNKWAKKIKLTDSDLAKAIDEINLGQFEVNLGGKVYKKRISHKGRGKSSSTRTLIAFKMNDKAFFIYGFEKNKRSNVTDKELQALKQYSKVLFSMPDIDIEEAVKCKELFEVIV